MGIRAVLIAFSLSAAAAHAAPVLASTSAESDAAVRAGVETAKEGAATEAPAPDRPNTKRRLTFKGNGPQCICANALGEADIQAAAMRQRASTTESRPTGSGK